jgi:hypothetical protein
MYGKDYEYASSRLENTIVRLGGEPVMVQRVDMDGVCMYNLLKDGGDAEFKRVEIDKLDLHPVPLGYVNKGAYCGFLTRIPKRHDWRQGLRKNNSMILRGANISYNGIYGKPLHRCIVGSYPSYKVCVQKIRAGGQHNIAWCRDFCLNHDGSVQYKGSFIVGRLDMDDGVELIKEFQYLQEKLETTL